MVDFNTRVFTEDDGKIIGAEVTVYSDSGDKLGLIDIADAETLEEMQEALQVIDETYFTDERLTEVLENTEETTVINATKLSGFLSSDFAKVSQLSSYALASHNHSKSQITDLYDYQITANKYDANLEDDLVVTVKVTNRATGNPVVGLSVPVLKNNETWKTGTTSVNGTFSQRVTLPLGVTHFSAHTASCQIKVSGWELVQTISSKMKVYSNGESVSLIITDRAKDTDGANIGTISSDYCPPTKMKVPCINTSNNSYVMIYPTDGGIYFYNGGYSGNNNIDVVATWPLI